MDYSKLKMKESICYFVSAVVKIEISRFVKRLHFYLILTLLFISHIRVNGQNDSIASDQDKKVKMSIKDPVDGAVDLSAFLESPVGFFPIPIIITEPAIGYGGGAALCFFHPHKGKGGKRVTPNISGVMGLGTQNKTWLAGAFHSHVFGNDKVRTLTAVAKPFVRIKYYGNNSEILSRFPVSLSMDSWVAMQRALVRIGDSKWFVGGSYVFFKTDVAVDTLSDFTFLNPIIKRLRGTSTISMIKPRINYDNRDNVFTPTKGFDAGVIFTYNASWLGADDDFYSFNEYLLAYVPIVPKLYSAYRFDGNHLIGDAPFYAYPYIQMRGIPAMRYQSDNTFVAETEWRYEVYKRWSLIGFTGAGKAFQSFDTFDNIEWAYTVGTGIRYKIAKIFGLRSGVDFAWGNGKDFAFYIVFGSSWNK